MTIFEALRLGIGALNRRKRLWFVFYAVTTIWALAFIAPIMTLLVTSLGNSAWAEQMAGNFDLQWVAEIIFGYAALPFAPVVAAVAAVFAAAAIVHLFLIGGAIQLFCAREPFTLATFFHGCGKHFWRFVRLALVSVLFFVVVGLVNSVLRSIGNRVWGEGSVETPLVYWNVFRIGIVLALAGLVNVIFDYARIRLVAEDSVKAFRAALFATKFVCRNFVRTAGLYIVVWIILLLILAVYRGISAALSQPAMDVVLLLFLIRQITILARTWVQLLFYSSQSEMYLALRPVVKMPEPPPEPPIEEAAPEPVAVAPEPEAVPPPEEAPL